MDAIIVQENGETFVDVYREGQDVERLTRDEAEVWLIDKANAPYDPKDCATSKCVWCKVNEALEGVR